VVGGDRATHPITIGLGGFGSRPDTGRAGDDGARWLTAPDAERWTAKHRRPKRCVLKLWVWTPALYRKTAPKRPFNFAASVCAAFGFTRFIKQGDESPSVAASIDVHMGNGQARHATFLEP